MRVELRLKIVTPLFLGGASQQAELRPASVRGALRFWLRAALGGVIGDQDLKRLHCLEAEVFGEAESGSNVSVRLSQPDLRYSKSREPLLPHKDGNEAEAVRCDGDLDLTLALVLRPCAEQKLLEIATWSALLWLTLGGLGRRSRRAAGSVRLVEVVSAPDTFSNDLTKCLNQAKEQKEDEGANGFELAKRIGDLQDGASRSFAAYAPTSAPKRSSDLPSFSVLLPATRIVVWTPANTDLTNYKTILKPLMNEMHRVKGNLSEAAFYDAFGGVSPQRRASPLLATAHRLKEGWALVLTYLKAEIQAGNKGKPKHVEDWLDQLLNKTPQEAFPCKVIGETSDE